MLKPDKILRDRISMIILEDRPLTDTLTLFHAEAYCRAADYWDSITEYCSRHNIEESTTGDFEVFCAERYGLISGGNE